MLQQIAGTELQAAVEHFRQRIRQELAPGGEPGYVNPSGVRRGGDSYQLQTPSGVLTIVVVPEGEHPTKYMHGVDIDGGPRSAPVLRFNMTKNVSGSGTTGTSIARDQETGNRCLCNTGKLTVYKRPLPKDAVLEYFGRSGLVAEMTDGRRRSAVIRIADLDGESLFLEIARFAKAVRDFKADYR